MMTTAGTCVDGTQHDPDGWSGVCRTCHTQPRRPVMATPKRITARKYGGDDAYSWAVFLDGRPTVTGLSQREVPYWKALIAREAGIAPPPKKEATR